MQKEEARTRWLWAFAPVNASAGIFLTLLPLYILNLGGNVVDVGLTTSVYIVSLVPSALIWGFSADSYPRRKIYITFSYLGMGAILLLIYLFGKLSLLPIFLALYGFISVAAVPAVNLLLMESFTKSSWTDMIARLSFISLIGYDAGIITGVAWSSFFKLEGLIALSAASSLLSGALAMKLIREPKIVFERKAILFSREVFTHRLRALPALFLSFPTVLEFRRFARMLRLTFLNEVPLLYLSVFVFDLGANIFGTSYTPALKQNYVLDNEIFLITFSNTATQTVLYFYIHKRRFFERYTVVDATKWVLGARSGIFLATSIAVALFQGSRLMAANMVIYAVLGGSFSFYNAAMSTLVFRTLGSQRQGEILGVYSALGGLFSFMGAISSGYLSLTIGYAATFLIAAVLMVLSLFLLNLSAKVGERVKLLHDIITYG